MGRGVPGAGCGAVDRDEDVDAAHSPSRCFMTAMLCSHRLLKGPQRDLPSGSGLFLIQPPQA